MDGAEPIEEKDPHEPGVKMDVLTISLIFCCMVTLLNILYLYPEMQARSDCANECNAALQDMYDACVVQNGYAPPLDPEGYPNRFILPNSTSWDNIPSPEYDLMEDVCMEILDNGSLVEAECP